MRLFFVFSLLTLAACVAPAPSLPENSAPFAATPTYGLAGQSVVIQATQESLALTRAVLDAQSADATQRAAEATAAWQATQSALSVEQTQAAMLATANESARLATHESAKATATAKAQSDIATAEAADTATARAFNGLLLQQAITSTGTALAIRAESLATQESARAQTAVNWQRVQSVVGEAAQWGALILIFGVILTGLYFAALIGQDARQHRREMQHQLLLQAGAETARATIIEIEKKNYQVKPNGDLVPFDQTITQSVENKAQASRLRAACKRMVYAAVTLGQAGERHPFGERALAIRAPIVTHPGTNDGWVEGYRTLMGVLVDSTGVLYAKQGKPTTWAKGWDLERFEREFDLLPLPDIDDTLIPDVQITLRSSALPVDYRSSAVPQIEEETES